MEKLTKKDITDQRIFRVSNYIKEQMTHLTHKLEDSDDERFYIPEGFDGYTLKEYTQDGLSKIDENRPFLMDATILVSEDGSDVVLAPIKEYGYSSEFLDDAIELFNIQ